MRGVNRTDTSDNDAEPIVASAARAKKRTFKVSRSANQKLHGGSSDFAIEPHWK
jgi:hypothetical protein